MKLYKVGGFVRDKILGVKSHDLDYAVECSSFEEMKNEIFNMGGEIFLSSPQFFTIRAQLNGEVADFVLCRKESGYNDGRHPDNVEVGTIYDDLARRDFTMNAIALCEDGTYLDPHGGIFDIERCLIRCVGNPSDRFNEDALRMLRAIRFSITKRFSMSDDIQDCLNDWNFVNLLQKISIERIRDELYKCFACDTHATLYLLHKYWKIGEVIFYKMGLKLKPTLERM